ncbi:aminodeoxychorismate synthase, component I [bacterium]|nr:aminodeoxychorismate synthase, component I [bacterium]
MLPLIEELEDALSPAEALAAFAAWPDVVLFESVLRRGELGRYSFLTADPFASTQIERSTYGLDPFVELRPVLQRCETEAVAGLPPFQGGAAGILSYELGGCWERLPRAAHDELQIPDAWVGVYDWVIAWDHESDRVWVISQGFPETERFARHQRAAKRLADVTAVLSGWPGLERGTSETPAPSGLSAPGLPSQAQSSPGHPVKRFPLPGHPGITSDFDRDGYLRTVERVIEYIRAGDIFQANLSQRLLGQWNGSSVELYQSLRESNPATFAGYLAHDDWAIVSSSPERFVRVAGGVAETRPIKGTRRRQKAEADLYTRDELRQSEKDIAENVMIVDLLRNDLSRVCEAGSIEVPQLCVVESYETVQHLVSEIRGTLKSDSGASSFAESLRLIEAVFPGGSITGAPKVRAMEIIAELELTERGPYCGSLFYCGFDGTFDSSILIRTLVSRGGLAQCSAGGGIVAQSDPVAEYEETLHKAEGMLRALRASSVGKTRHVSGRRK